MPADALAGLIRADLELLVFSKRRDMAAWVWNLWSLVVCHSVVMCCFVISWPCSLFYNAKAELLLFS
jgi:hypothetical protein